MKIALVTAEFRNGDIAFNLAQVEKNMRRAKAEGAELACFGEAFLQGFDGFNWDYKHDKNMSVSVQDEIFLHLLALTRDVSIDLLIGFLERDGAELYSSCALLNDGKLHHLYRRVSKGWKEYTRTDGHYREGTVTEPFYYDGKKCMIAICGDLWDCPERFALGEELLFWPLFINYGIEEWMGGAADEYAQQALLACKDVLMIDSLCGESGVFGGSCRFQNGIITQTLSGGKEGILIVEV